MAPLIKESLSGFETYPCPVFSGNIINNLSDHFPNVNVLTETSFSPLNFIESAIDYYIDVILPNLNLSIIKFTTKVANSLGFNAKDYEHRLKSMIPVMIFITTLFLFKCYSNA